MDIHGNKIHKEGCVTRIILIRHGETLWDIEKRHIGHLDIPLSPLGKQQSLAIAKRLQHISFSQLYSSDLGRAMYTANCIASACNKTVNIDVGLREKSMSGCNGCVSPEVKKNTLMATHEVDAPAYLHCITPKMESLTQRQARVINVMNSLAHSHANETIVVVSHLSIVKSFLAFVLGIDIDQLTAFTNRNAGFNSFVKEGGSWTLEAWDEQTHLQSVSTTPFNDIAETG